MIKNFIILCFMIVTLFLTASCDLVDRAENKAAMINRYEKISLNLIKENRILQAEINALEFKIEKLKSENQFLSIQLNQKSGRSVASLPPASLNNDQVRFDIYKWSPAQLLTMAETEFEKKNYEKSAQFFKTFLIQYPTSEKIDDRFLFQAGISAFESGQHYDWALATMDRLVSDYPDSKYFRGAKLWYGLAHLRLGNHKEFFGTVEEFRKKYRNTPEWKILSFRYEEIVQKYKD